LRDPAFGHFGTIPACDRQLDGHTDRQTDGWTQDDSIYRTNIIIIIIIYTFV